MRNANSGLGLKEELISIRVKLALLWACTMFLYIYADIKALFETGFIQQIMDGNLGGIIVDQSFLLISSILMTIPPVMIVLTILLKAKVNRIVNIIISALHILLASGLLLFAPIRPWFYFIWYSCFEILFLFLIVLFALKWPKEK